MTDEEKVESQSLSGWDGVFHDSLWEYPMGEVIMRVAIPFRVGWGFSHSPMNAGAVTPFTSVAIPFRVGWGFSLTFWRAS